MHQLLRGSATDCRGPQALGKGPPAGGTGSAPGTPRHPRPAPVREDRLSPSCAPSFRTTSYLRPVYTPPGGRTGRLAGAQFPSAAVYASPTARTIRPPDRAAAAGNGPGRLTMESSASAGRVASAVLDPRRWQALALLRGAFFMVLLDGTITIVALPSIGVGLHFSEQGLQWVLSAYALTFGGLLLLGGRAADLLGRQRAARSSTAPAGGGSSSSTSPSASPRSRCRPYCCATAGPC